MNKLSVLAQIAALLAASLWAAHHADFIGILKRLHAGQ
jgi:hypothetical protein